MRTLRDHKAFPRLISGEKMSRIGRSTRIASVPSRMRAVSVRTFFPGNNHQHHHSGLQLLTPATVHYGQAAQLISKRQSVLDVAYQAHPERFVRRAPQHPSLPEAVWINPPASNKENTP